MQAPAPDSLPSLLDSTPELSFAVLVGSRATGIFHEQSDWDIALRWKACADPMHHLARHEHLRHAIAHALASPEDKIDLIDLATARLAMRAEVANVGIPLCINDELAWAYFQTSTWRQLEDFHWDRSHAA